MWLYSQATRVRPYQFYIVLHCNERCHETSTLRVMKDKRQLMKRTCLLLPIRIHKKQWLKNYSWVTVLNASVNILIVVATISFETDMVKDLWENLYFFRSITHKNYVNIYFIKKPMLLLNATKFYKKMIIVQMV